MDAPMMHIGNLGVAQNLTKATESILKILKTNVGEQVKMRALETLAEVAKVENVTVNGSNFRGDSPEIHLTIPEHIRVDKR